MGYTLNLTKDEAKSAAGGGFEPLPVGTYGAVVYDVTQSASKSSGNQMYTINFKITSEHGKGRKVRAYYSFSPKALFKLVELNKAIGLPVPSKNGGDFEIPDADEYLSEEVNIQLSLDPYASVATADDVEANKTAEDEDKILNSDTGEPVTEEGEPVVKYRNGVKRVFAYDESRHTDPDAEDSEGPEGNLYLS